MYIYDHYDQNLVDERVQQYREQTQRYLDGKLSEDEFLQLRLRNGLYIQRLAPMLRVCIPYGMLSTTQVRTLATLSDDYDKGYVHFSTRQNVQYNWPELADVPDMLAELAKVQMHAIQTSGSCIRNTTTSQFAGVSPTEVADPRPYCELIRQWSTFHPEFNWLPRKFKIAVNADTVDYGATNVHDIGLHLKQQNGELGFQVTVGGGLGRTPVVSSEIKAFLPERHLLTYLEAILRVYNRLGRRDNKYKARIKILVRATGVETFAEQVEQQWQGLKDGESTITEAELTRIKQHFVDPEYKALNDSWTEVDQQAQTNKAFFNWLKRNVKPHKQAGYSMVTLSLKPTGIPPGDASHNQLNVIADLADKYSFGEVRVSHAQNLILADVEQNHLFELWQILKANHLATPNIGLLTDIISCPGGDYCSLANAKSIPVAEAIQRRFDDLDYLHDLGEIELNISGCMNACSHHHVGHIGILGVDKKGSEFYQISLGGSAGLDTSLGKILGPSFGQDAIPDIISTVLDVYLEQRIEDEPFLHTYRRIGIKPFKERVYA